MIKTGFFRKVVCILCLLTILFVPYRKISQAIPKTVNLITISSMEEDWSNMYHLGDFRYDFRDAAEGKGCLELIPDNVDGFAGVETSFYPTNLSLHGFRFYMKSNDWDLVYTLVITFHTYSDWEDYFVLEVAWNLESKPNNEWIEVVLSPSEFIKVGNPTWQSISKVTFRTDVNPGKRCQVKVDGLSCFFNRQQSAVSIVFDDGHLSTMRAKNIMDEFGVRGTLFAIPNYIYEPEFLNQSMIDMLHKWGWDIGGHSDQVLTELTPEQLQAEFKMTKDYLTINGYRGSNIYAFPYGVYNQQVVEIGSQYFEWLRPNDSLNQPSGYVSPYRINTRNVSVYTPVETVKLWIDRAKEHNDWLILVFHRIEDEPIYDTDYTEESFREIIQYTLDNEIEILTMSEYLDRYNQ